MSEEYVPAFPKPGIVRLRGKAKKSQRERCFKEAHGRCTKCGRVLLPGWHAAHIKGKRNHGDIENGKPNIRARCPECHLVGDHNPKSVPPKKGPSDASRREA